MIFFKNKIITILARFKRVTHRVAFRINSLAEHSWSGKSLTKDKHVRVPRMDACNIPKKEKRALLRNHDKNGAGLLRTFKLSELS